MMDDADTTIAQRLEEAQSRIHELETQVEKLQQSEAKLLEDRWLLDAIMKHTPDYVFMKDRKSRFLRTNAAHTELLGLDDPQEAVGKSDFDFFPAESAQKFFEEEQTIMATQQEVTNREWDVGENATGETIWLSEHKIAVTNDEGEVVGLLGMSRVVTERKKAEQEVARLYAEIEQEVEKRTEELRRETEERERLQQQIIDTQRSNLRALSTPIIPLMDGIIIMPLIGHIDSVRSADIMRALLAGITTHRARVVIIDITGVPMVDTAVAGHLHKTILAARLKGTRTIITGLSDTVAETIVDIGIDWSEIETLYDLQAGVRAAMGRVNN
jgi:rsbT co-antagonist protein RsbR